MGRKTGTWEARPKRRGFGIQGKLFLYLLGFTAIVLLLIWLFQICLLGPFYEQTKYDELNRTADELSYFLDDEEALKTAVYDYASRYNLCISLYKLDGSSASEITKSHVTGACAVHMLSDSDRLSLYEAARENGGSLSVTYPVVREFYEWDADVTVKDIGDSTLNESEDTVSQNDSNSSALGEDTKSAEDGQIPALHVVKEESVNAVSVHILRSHAGKSYILLIDSKLTPVSAIVSTLQTQVLWLAAILLLLALILAVWISRVVSRPIVSMNESAKRLAAGDYSVVFVGAGFRESRELAETLNYASVELSKTDELQKELIANISHDLRTPLTMIKAYSEIMRDLPGENSPENVQVVIDEAERLNELVSDLLDLSRIRSGSRAPQPELFDLTETVRATFTRYEKLTRHDGYTIELEGQCEYAAVYADRTMILQVLYNLINNAINYTGDDKRVTVTETLENDTVRIAVSDTGEGISKEQLPLIWDRYYKIDKVHRRAAVGTGLGLSIVKQILELHGATYGVSSTIGKGSTFWFALPIIPQRENVP